MTPSRVYPPERLSITRGDLEGFARSLTEISVLFNDYNPDRVGPRADLVWFKGARGTIWSVVVDDRYCEFQFEVFSLCIENVSASWEINKIKWPKYVTPLPEINFQRMPFDVGIIHVLQRGEFILSDPGLQGAVGENPVWKSGSDPDNLPKEAEATCIVSVGLLLTGEDGSRLLVAADWFPLNLIVTQDDASIEEFTSQCTAVEISEYTKTLRS